MSEAPEVEVEEVYGICPVQAEGTVNGVPFYFRARGSRWSMEIGPGNTGEQVAAAHSLQPYEDMALLADLELSVDSAPRARMAAVAALGCWRYEEPWGRVGGFDAGYMDELTARVLIVKAAELWLADQAAPKR